MHRRGRFLVVYVSSLVVRHARVNFRRLGTVNPRVNTEDLIGATEVAGILGLAHHNSVSTYLRRYDDFPRPVVDLNKSRIRLWLRPDVEAWRREHPASGAER